MKQRLPRSIIYYPREAQTIIARFKSGSLTASSISTDEFSVFIVDKACVTFLSSNQVHWIPDEPLIFSADGASCGLRKFIFCPSIRTSPVYFRIGPHAEYSAAVFPAPFRLKGH